MASRKGRVSAREQGFRRIQEMMEAGIGTSKHADKAASRGQRQGDTAMAGKVYSYETAHMYRRAWERYCDSMREDGFVVNGHHPRSLEEAAAYMPAYLDKLANSPGKSAGSRMSAATVRTYFSGAAKVLGLSATDYDLPSRRYGDITRSRGPKASDGHFSEATHADLVGFCRSTGLRARRELERLHGDQLRQLPDGGWGIEVRGKGGRVRTAPVIGSPEQVRAVVSRMQAAGSSLVWDKVPSGADIHGYRREYAQTLYASIARPVEQLSAGERYQCRRDSRQIFDRRAMAAVSQALGHSRLDVVAGHYLAR